MNHQEATALCAYVRQLCPQQRINEFTPDVWGDVLGPYDATEARAAVVAVASRQPFVAPAEIIAEIKARRAERIELANIVVDGDPSHTGAESAAALREILRAAGNGLTGPNSIGRSLGTAERLALPPGDDHGPYAGRAAAARAGIGKMPTGRDTTHDPRGRACRRCGAAAGSSCTAGKRRLKDPHPIRLQDTQRAAAGLPLLDPDAEQDRIKAAAAAALALRDEDQEPEVEAS
ncbi:hypothetical protein GCM10010372_30980 [Streptomyces tauricus]|uniref:hypothetical protein n=1 Tax=Streptomyces tauricus TaxID=68274 RepID=UPI0016792E0A|nr:hypothetical protein [Streptomyces tauricus]GHA28901.1 hypothetical protein GCM10010372_30980 [Streptomyces tauricus]